MGLLLALWLAAGPATRASADADPASDILLGSSVFLPFFAPVPPGVQHQLKGELSELHRQGMNLKVAVIAKPVDLGAIPNMFGKPQTYADFLETELSFLGPQPLLIVMPDGFGVARVAGRAADALAGVAIDRSHGAAGLARTAIVAVRRLAGAAGKPLPGGSGRGPSGGSGKQLPVAAIVIAVLLVALAGAIIGFRRWPARRTGAPAGKQRRRR